MSEFNPHWGKAKRIHVILLPTSCIVFVSEAQYIQCYLEIKNKSSPLGDILLLYNQLSDCLLLHYFFTLFSFIKLIQLIPDGCTLVLLRTKTSAVCFAQWCKLHVPVIHWAASRCWMGMSAATSEGPWARGHLEPSVNRQGDVQETRQQRCPAAWDPHWAVPHLRTGISSTWHKLQLLKVNPCKD